MNYPLDDLLEYISARAEANGSDFEANEAASQRLLATNPALFNVLLCVQSSDWARAKDHLCELLGRRTSRPQLPGQSPVFSFGPSERQKAAQTDSGPAPFLFKPLSARATDRDS